jgi:hypothetical protein
MKVRELRWLFIAVLACLFVLSFIPSSFEPVTIGVSVDLSNGHYHFAGGTDPRALLIASIVIPLYLLLMRAVPEELGNPLSGLFRRYVAFWLDFMLAMFVIGPVIGILPMIAEWRRTGVFHWTFERDSPAPGDAPMATVSISCAFAALLLYFAWPLVCRRPSPGACVLRYQVVPDEGEALPFRKAVARTLLGFVAVASFPLALFIKRDRKKGKFWVDKVFDTRAVH